MNLFKTTLLGFCALTLSACDSAKQSSSQVEAQLKTAKISTELPHYLQRDIRDEVFYFVMPDRFHNGDSSNDNGSTTILESQGGFDPTSNGHYHGGDIIGLKEKLPYLQDMGITAIWMTPIMRNQAVQGDSSGYHGYWVLDFTEIDPHLGSDQDLKDLIAAAHKLNMKVFFDIIANHSADVIKYKECHGENGDQQLGETKGLCDYKTLEQIANDDTYSAFVLPGSENIKVPQWLNDPKYYNNQGDSTWEGESAIYGDFAGLDDIDTANPEVISGLIEVFKGVVTEFKPDGFRIDTVKHVNMEFWTEFSPAIVEHAQSIGIPQFFMFGEVYDFTPEFLSTFTTTGKMQSILDFALQGAIAKALVEHKGTNELETIFNKDHYYQDEDSDASMLVTYTGNHDMGRFAHMLDKANPEMSNAEKLARVKLSNALMYFSRGIPVVYYGDEQGFVGDGNDKNSRQDMMPSKVAIYNDDDLLGTDATTADANFDQSHVLYQDLVSLANLYLQHDALRHGKQEQVYSQQTSGLYAFTRTDENAQYLIVANTATTDQSQTMTMSYKGFEPVVSAKDKDEQDGVVTINLAPLSYAIYKAHK